jgi:hypothetical protein
MLRRKLNDGEGGQVTDMSFIRCGQGISFGEMAGEQALEKSHSGKDYRKESLQCVLSRKDRKSKGRVLMWRERGESEVACNGERP